MADWSTYLLKRVPESLKADIRAEAAQYATSPSNVVRSILCDYFGLDCPPRRAYQSPPYKPEADTLFIRLQPELFAEIKAEATSRNTDQREVMLSILKSHYGHNGGHPHD